MKKGIIILLILSFVLILCFMSAGFSHVSEDKKMYVNYNGTHKELEKEDCDEMNGLLNGHLQYWEFGIPACGFSKEVSLEFDDGMYYCIAQDECNTFRVSSSKKYFNVSERVMKRVKEILEKYGAHFPCV